MKQILFTFVTVFFSLWVQISVANWGFVLPLLFLQLFYITVVRKWRWGMLIALIACSVLDSLLGYFSLPAAVCMIVCASFWRNIGDCGRLELQFFPVGVALFPAVLILMAGIYFRYGGYIEWLQWFWQFLFGVGVTAIIAPTLFKLQDFLAIRLEISTYSDIQHEELYSASGQ